MEDIFFHEKGKQILLSLDRHDNQYVSEIAGSIDGTYAHTFNLLKGMDGLGIITAVKKGRTKYIKLTPKGKQLAKIIQNFETTLEKGLKNEESSRTTPTQEKLERYKTSLTIIKSDVKSRKLKKKEVAKYLRSLGRYKSLILRLRPRDKVAKDLKSDVTCLIGEIELVLKKYKQT